MPAPYNYMLNVPNPAQSVANAVTLGRGIQQVRAEGEEQRAGEQMRADLAALAENPTPSEVTRMMVKYPSLSEHFKRSYDVLNAEQQQSRVTEASEIYAALTGGDTDTALSLMEERAAAYRNSGMEREAKMYEGLAEGVRVHPGSGAATAGLLLASAMGPENFTQTYTALANERREASRDEATLTEAQSRARKAAVDADFAESMAVSELERRGWDIFKIQEDTEIARENSRIAAMNAELNRERNDIARQELETRIAAATTERDNLVRTRAADVESARSNIDNTLNTIDRILATPYHIMDDAMGPISQRMPTTKQGTADFEALVGNLEAQAFLAQIPNIKGQGALSNAEGDKLARALQSLVLTQGPQQFVDNLRESQRLLLKARENLALRYGLPDTVPDTPAAGAVPPPTSPAADDISAIVDFYFNKPPPL